MEEIEMEENTKKKRLSPEATVLLTIGATALFTVVYRVMYFIITGS